MKSFFVIQYALYSTLKRYHFLHLFHAPHISTSLTQKCLFFLYVCVKIWGMNTKQLTRGAMCCAIYGALLFLNQQTGLMIETSASWIFLFPILIYTALYNYRVASIVAIAMGLMTFMFGGFTTWFYSWFAIIAGYAYGIGLYHKQKNWINFVGLTILCILSNALMTLLWANIFGMDMHQDFQAFSTYVPFIRFDVFVIVVIVMLSVLEALSVHLVALMICTRMHMPIRPIQPISDIPSPRWVGIVSIGIWIAFLFTHNQTNLSSWVQTVIQCAWIFDCMVLDFYGVVYYMTLVSKHNQRKRAPWAILGAFIPVLQIMWILSGEFDCLFQIRKNHLDMRVKL